MESTTEDPEKWTELKRELEKWQKEGLSEEKTRINIISSIKKTYPEYTSRVLLTPKSRLFGVKNRPGFGRSWKDEQTNNFKVRVYSVQTSALKDRGGKCTENEKTKAQKIANELVGNQRRKVETKNDSIHSVLNEAADRLTKEKLHWLIIEVGEKGEKNDFSGNCQWTDFSNICSVHAYGKHGAFEFGLRIYFTK